MERYVMYAKHCELVDMDASGTKASTKHLESCSEASILGLLKSRRGTAYYCIIMWALESEIPTYVITVPERHRQTDGQTDDILWHNRALHSIAW